MACHGTRLLPWLQHQQKERFRFLSKTNQNSVNSTMSDVDLLLPIGDTSTLRTFSPLSDRTSMKTITRIDLRLAWFATFAFLYALPPQIAVGQTAPAIDPTDPLAKPAPKDDPASGIFLVFFPMTGSIEQLDKHYPLPQDPKTIRTVRQVRYERLRDSTLGVFEKTAGAKAMWAPEARRAMESYSRAFARRNAKLEGVYYQALLETLKAVDKACDDPLVAYWKYRYPGRDSYLPRDVPDYRTIVARLLASKSYPLFTAYAALNFQTVVRRLAALPDSILTAKDAADADEKFDRALGEAIRAAKTANWEDLYDIGMLEIDLLMEDGTGRKTAWAAVDRKLVALKAPAWVRDAVEAKVLIQAGWEARGSGAGDTVGEDDFKEFRDSLRKAKAKLEAAWKAEPKLATAPTAMLYVAKGLGFPREEMEEWFRRAMEADPDNLEACKGMKDWLQPKWHGTESDVNGFLAQCFRTGNYYGRLPYAAELPMLHDFPYRQQNVLDQITGSNSVWASIQLVADTHLERYPDDKWARSRYAYHACLWRQWVIAVEQFEKIGPKPWGIWFRHEGEYDAAVKIAKEKAKAMK